MNQIKKGGHNVGLSNSGVGDPDPLISRTDVCCSCRYPSELFSQLVGVANQSHTVRFEEKSEKTLRSTSTSGALILICESVKS